MVLHYRTSLSTPWERDLELSLKCLVFVLEVALQLDASDDGKVLVILDRRGTQRRNQDVELIRRLADTLSNHYPETLFRALVCPSGWLFRSICLVVKLFLDPVTAGKVRALGASAELEEDVDKCQLLAGLGGEDDWDFEPEELYGLHKMPDNWVQDSYERWQAER